MVRRRTGVAVLAIVAVVGGATATRFASVTDSTMLLVLGFGILAMVIGAYRQRGISE